MLSVVRKLKNKVFTAQPEHGQIITHTLNHKLIDKNAINIIKTLTSKGFDAYLVGGCIRDILLGLKPKDFDIATNATPKQIHKLFKRSRIIGRRFQIVHVLFGRRDFIEVSTFRGAENNTKMIKNDNNFGSIKTDAIRRDLTINALYYQPFKHEIIDIVGAMDDINNKNIVVIGDTHTRFNQDPVRMLRVVRFSVKLGFSVDAQTTQLINDNKHLLKNIPAARMFEETLKLFHNSKSYQTFTALQTFDLLQFLFPKVEDSAFIKISLDNTATRIKNGFGVSPAFIFAVFLYEEYLQTFATLKKKNPNNIASQKAASEVILKQIKYVSVPKFVTAKVINTWNMQYFLEQKNSKNIDKIVAKPDFRMGYDFLLMRSQSTHPELKDVADFWTSVQKKTKNYEHK